MEQISMEEYSEQKLPANPRGAADHNLVMNADFVEKLAIGENSYNSGKENVLNSNEKGAAEDLTHQVTHPTHSTF